MRLFSERNEQLLEFCNVSGMDREAVEDRWATKDMCYLAYLEGRLADYSWVKSSGVQQGRAAEIQLPVIPGEFWIYHCWTGEWPRGRKLYRCMLVMIVQNYFSSGFTRAHIYTSRTNLASQRGIDFAGFRYTSSKSSLKVSSHWYKLK